MSTPEASVYVLTYDEPGPYDGDPTTERTAGVFFTREAAQAQIVADVLNGTGPVGAVITEHHVQGEVPMAVQQLPTAAFTVDQATGLVRARREEVARALGMSSAAEWGVLFERARDLVELEKACAHDRLMSVGAAEVIAREHREILGERMGMTGSPSWAQLKARAAWLLSQTSQQG